MKPLAALLWIACLPALALPSLVLTHDDTRVRESCEIMIDPGTVIPDTNHNGVLHIEADGITVRFARHAELRGAPAGSPWHQLTGLGIRILGHRHVRIENARVHGFLNGVVATRADGLVIHGGDFSDNFRQRLRSTPRAEDSADWLFPHRNDERKWRDEYGGAVCLEESSAVTVRGIRVRRGQNGILLDRVTDSRIYDNDCSFLSGWGLALWRSSRNLISRNAFDFCVRGHVEGVYNRGQDSAGILCFEQSSENAFVENSATHGGDGFFGFAGREAIGETWIEAERERLRRETGRTDVDDPIPRSPSVTSSFAGRGCNRNILMGNDFSYASAHGIEMTFSHGNVFARNRLVENAICGIWGGYSTDSLIAENAIHRNGGMAYGRERGGINLEHASGNRILRNDFRDNRCAIHLWWDPDVALRRLPGVAAHDRGVTGNVMAGNRFSLGARPPFPSLRPAERLVILEMRDEGTNNVRDNLYFRNRTTLNLSNALEFDLPAHLPFLNTQPSPDHARYSLPTVRPIGRQRPVGARAILRGRHQIILDEWGPWDHRGPLVRPIDLPGHPLAFEVLGLDQPPRVTAEPPYLTPASTSLGPGRWQIALSTPPGITPYRIHLAGPGLNHSLAGTLVTATWDVRFFPSRIDPRTDPAAWRSQAEGSEAVRATPSRLDFSYGSGGPGDLRIPGLPATPRLPPDHFGMLARTRLPLPAGRWRLVTLSDDGVRVRLNGQTLIENWTWHGPTRDETTWTQLESGEIEFEVEHFELDGYSILRFDLEPLSP